MKSRVARKPITIPSGVEITVKGTQLHFKGAKGIVDQDIPNGVIAEIHEGNLSFKVANQSRSANALAGTARALANNTVLGVSQGYERKLTLVGVGYRAAVKGNILAMTLGFSHPVDFEIPEGIVIETPSQTEVVIKGICKQRVGQVAANIRRYRPPEPYKGKGVRYSDEKIKIKETKKK